MSAKSDIALKIKMGSCNIKDLEDLLRNDDIELIHFDKNSYMYDESGDSDITREQIEAIDKMISSNQIKKLDESKRLEVVPDYFSPNAANVDFIEKGKIIVRVMDNHNFYEADQMSDEYLKDAPIGLLTKIWISISRSLKE